MFAQPNGPRQNVSRSSFHGQPIHVYANQWAATIFIFSSLARNLSDATRPIGPQSEGFCSKKFFHIRCCSCAKQMVHNNVLSLQKKKKQIRYCLATHWTATMCSCFQKKTTKHTNNIKIVPIIIQVSKDKCPETMCFLYTFPHASV